MNPPLVAWLGYFFNQVPPKSAVGKTIGYSLRQWPKLIRHIDHGNFNIDNNRAEWAIKPCVIGRKNWMFANTANGAKANGLIPFDCIKHLLEELLRNYQGTIKELSRNYQGTRCIL